MKILGHRGDGVSNLTPEMRRSRRGFGKEPENTLPAFEKAIKNGADGVELDVFLSKDGKIMVIHDDEVAKHAVDGGGLVSEQTCAELQKYDVGNGYYMPTLEQVIAVCGDDSIINVELKGDDAVVAVLDVINQSQNKDRFLISSFNKLLIEEARKNDPDIRLGLLLEKGEPVEWVIDFAVQQKLYSLHPDVDDIYDAMLQNVESNDLKVVGWTSGESAEKRWWFERLETLLEKGYDFWVITDFPELVGKRCLES